MSMLRKINMVNNDLYLIGLLVFLFGLIIGSFLNVVIDRVSQNVSINGRSHCDHCKVILQWYDLIPLISFFSLKGKCRYCQHSLSYQYPLVEFITGLFFVLSLFANSFRIDLNLLRLLIVTSCSIVIIVTDLKWQIILDEVLVILFFVGLLTHPPTIFAFFGGAIMIGVLFALVHILSNGRAMGYADVKLVFIMGMLLNISKLLTGLYISFLTGGVISAILLLSRSKKLKSKIAFGPFLVIGLLVMLWL